jgi:hypothetical protein
MKERPVASARVLRETTGFDTGVIKLNRADLLAAIQSRHDWQGQRQIASELGVSQRTVGRALSAASMVLYRGSAVTQAEIGENTHGGLESRSEACREPCQRQAEILPCDQGRRHPYEGNRPKWSDYCAIRACSCWCHHEGLPRAA